MPSVNIKRPFLWCPISINNIMPEWWARPRLNVNRSRTRKMTIPRPRIARTRSVSNRRLIPKTKTWVILLNGLVTWLYRRRRSNSTRPFAKYVWRSWVVSEFLLGVYSFQTHISDLPPELVINILKWVVTSQLDLRSLERFSESCRWFYLLARSEEIWRLVCLRTWDQLVDRPLAISWREHFLTQPRVRVSGCYIARSSYTRQGERGFQDNKNTRTWHLVRYCRFLRFFPGGRVAMITSADPPQNVVKTLALTA